MILKLRCRLLFEFDRVVDGNSTVVAQLKRSCADDFLTNLDAIDNRDEVPSAFT
jgi:hypothetical protein